MESGDLITNQQPRRRVIRKKTAIEKVRTFVKKYFQDEEQIHGFITNEFEKNELVKKLSDKVIECRGDNYEYTDNQDTIHTIAEYLADNEWGDNYLEYLFNSLGENCYAYTERDLTAGHNSVFSISDFWELITACNKWATDEVGDDIIDLEKNVKHAWDCIYYWIAKTEFKEEIHQELEKGILNRVLEDVESVVIEWCESKSGREYTTTCDICYEQKLIHCVPLCCKGKMLCYTCYSKCEHCPFCREPGLTMLANKTTWFLEPMAGEYQYCDCCGETKVAFWNPPDKHKWNLGMIKVQKEIVDKYFEKWLK